MRVTADVRRESPRKTIGEMQAIHIRDVEFEDEAAHRLAHLGVDIVTTGQKLRGRRRWFRCPQCTRRCATIYLAEDGLACRLCAALGYVSQNLHKRERVLRRLFALYDRLNVDYSQWPRKPGPKPKWMRWDKYWKLYGDALNLDAQALSLIASRRRRLRSTTRR